MHIGSGILDAEVYARAMAVILSVAERLPKGHAVIVPATEIAMKHVGRPVPNAALLGALAALTRFVRLESVEHAIEQAFPGRIGAANIAAAREAHQFVLSQQHAEHAA